MDTCAVVDREQFLIDLFSEDHNQQNKQNLDPKVEALAEKVLLRIVDAQSDPHLIVNKAITIAKMFYTRKGF